MKGWLRQLWFREERMQILELEKSQWIHRAIVRATERLMGKNSGRGWHETKLERQVGA